MKILLIVFLLSQKFLYGQGVSKEKGFLSSLLPDLSKEDLILIGIIIALAFDLADRDILLVALVAAAVIM